MRECMFEFWMMNDYNVAEYMSLFFFGRSMRFQCRPSRLAFTVGLLIGSLCACYASPSGGRDRIVYVDEGETSISLVAVMEPGDPNGEPLTPGDVNEPFGQPESVFVAGESAGPDAHTLVRILDIEGRMETQFLAYPPDVRGGVDTHIGMNGLGQREIVCTPLRDETVRELRVFNRFGGLLRTIEVDPVLDPPFSILLDDWDRDYGGQEMAVLSRNGKGEAPDRVLLYTMTGFLIQSWDEENQENRTSLTLFDLIQRLGRDVSGVPADRADGREGEDPVHLLPFVWNTKVKRLAVDSIYHEGRKDFRAGPFERVEKQTVLEISFKAMTESEGRIYWSVYRDRTRIPELYAGIYPPKKWIHCRFTLRVERAVENIVLRILAHDDVQIEDFIAVEQRQADEAF